MKNKAIGRVTAQALFFKKTCESKKWGIHEIMTPEAVVDNKNSILLDNNKYRVLVEISCCHWMFCSNSAVLNVI